MKSLAKTLFVAVLLMGAAPPRPEHGRLVRELAFPEERDSLETLFRGVSAAGRFGDRVIALTTGKAAAAVAPFRPDGASREAVFGKVSDGDRREIFKGPPGDLDWRAVDVVGNKALLFDGRGLSFVEADGETLAEVARRSVPWDTLRPPRDRGGEATGWETAEFRARFARAVQATPGVKVVGLARIPAGWRGKVRGYFAVTRLKGFPLLELECQGGDDQPSGCVVARACHVSGLDDVLLADRVGAAAVERDGEKLILLADVSRNAVLSLRYDSCFHVARAKRQWILPARLKELTNFSVDADGQLWVSTATPDDYLNASLYVWRKGDW